MNVKDFDRRRGKVLGDYLTAIERLTHEVNLSLKKLREENGEEGSMDLPQIDSALRTIAQALGRTSLPAELRKPSEGTPEVPIDDAAADKKAKLDSFRGMRVVRGAS